MASKVKRSLFSKRGDHNSRKDRTNTKTQPPNYSMWPCTTKPYKHSQHPLQRKDKLFHQQFGGFKLVGFDMCFACWFSSKTPCTFWMYWKSCDSKTRKVFKKGVVSQLKYWVWLNPYMPCGLFHPYQMDKSISSFRGAWCTFFLFSFFF